MNFLNSLAPVVVFECVVTGKIVVEKKKCLLKISLFLQIFFLCWITDTHIYYITVNRLILSKCTLDWMKTVIKPLTETGRKTALTTKLNWLIGLRMIFELWSAFIMILCAPKKIVVVQSVAHCLNISFFTVFLFFFFFVQTVQKIKKNFIIFFLVAEKSKAVIVKTPVASCLFSSYFYLWEGPGRWGGRVKGRLGGGREGLILFICFFFFFYF